MASAATLPVFDSGAGLSEGTHQLAAEGIPPGRSCGCYGYLESEGGREVMWRMVIRGAVVLIIVECCRDGGGV